MQIVKNYREDAALRASFNALAEATFDGLNFETWYQHGHWTDSYQPYAVVEDGRVVANVSVNDTPILVDGQVRRLYQIGTVMTDPAYRDRGLSRLLMAEIEKDLGPGADGFYLFAHTGVLQFYPKFGFTPAGGETAFSRPLAAAQPGADWQQVPMDGPAAWARLWAAMEQNAFHGSFDMVQNPGLVMFYAGQFLTDCVYHSQVLNAWIIAEPDGDTLTLHAVFSPDAGLTLAAVADTLGGLCPECTTLTLGFAPTAADAADGWQPTLLADPDTTLFVKGRFFEQGGFDKAAHRFPTLAHA